MIKAIQELKQSHAQEIILTAGVGEDKKI